MSRFDALVFDLKGDLAHFRKVYTTASQLTYGVPPRTTLAGLIAAIIGLPRDSYYNMFSKQNSNIAVSIESPIKKQRININLLKTKDETLGFVRLFAYPPVNIEHIQVPFEMVRNPHYRIYVWLRNESAFRDLEKNLENHRSVFTPYLGITELICDFEYQGKHVAKKIRGEAEVKSIVRKDLCKIKVETEKRYVRESVPAYMDKQRNPEYADVIYETDGKSLLIEKSEYWEVNGRNVLFF